MSNQNNIDDKSVPNESVVSLGDITKGKIDKLLDGPDPVVSLRPGQKLVGLKYVHEDVSEPLVSLVTRKFGIDVNIMLADVQIAGKSPIGGIVAVFEGPERHIADAIDFLRGKRVLVEIFAEA